MSFLRDSSGMATEKHPFSRGLNTSFDQFEEDSYFRKNLKVLLITSGRKSQNRDDSMAPVSTQEEQDSAFF